MFTSILNGRRGGSNGLVAYNDGSTVSPDSPSDMRFRRSGCKSNLNEIAFSGAPGVRASLSCSSVIRIAVKLLISVVSLAAMVKMLFLPGRRPNCIERNVQHGDSCLDEIDCLQIGLQFAGKYLEAD